MCSGLNLKPGSKRVGGLYISRFYYLKWVGQAAKGEPPKASEAEQREEMGFLRAQGRFEKGCRVKAIVFGQSCYFVL